MKRLLCCWVLLAMLFASCVSDEEQMPVFVTDVALESEGLRAPGDELSVTAQGLRPDDEVLFDIRWSSQTGASAAGSARGIYAVVTARSATGLSFLAPGGYPASEVEVLLQRQGRTQSLGRFACSDGQAPRTASLYGIVRAGAEDTLIERLDPLTGERTPVTLLSGYGMRCAVNDPGSNRIYGLCPGEADGRGLFYDLTMRCVRDSDPEHYAAVGRLSIHVAYLRGKEDRLHLAAMTESRTLPAPTPCWTLPEGLTAEMLSGAPFVTTQTEGALLLAADLGDGRFAPVVLFSVADGCRVAVGEPVRAAALVPFNRLETAGEAEEATPLLAGGYVLSAVDGRTTCAPWSSASRLQRSMHPYCPSRWITTAATSTSIVWSPRRRMQAKCGSTRARSGPGVRCRANGSPTRRSCWPVRAALNGSGVLRAFFSVRT